MIQGTALSISTEKTMRCVPALLLILALVGCQSVPDSESPPAEPAGLPTTDIHLFSMSEGTVAAVSRITNRDGYDNQPFFAPDGSKLLFTSDREGQMDTFAYQLSDGSTERLTHTEEGEYSPTTLPADAQSFSVIRMDTSGVQELWKYSVSEESSQKLAEIDRVGYHTWVGDDRILFFRLGSPNTLQLVTAGRADTTVVATRVGRSLHRIPGQRASSYLQVADDGQSEIMRFDWDSGMSTPLAAPIEGQQDYTWTPDGTILMLVLVPAVRRSGVRLQNLACLELAGSR